MQSHDEQKPDRDEPPPFLGRWSRIYAGVLLYLAALIVLLYAITRMYRM